jgi:hypothetical protein
MSTILITAANSAQAQQLKNVLGAGDVILGDYLDIPEVLLKSGKMIKTPNPKSAAFIHQMLALCLDKHISKVYALRRDELLPLEEARQLFAEFDIKLIIPSKKIIDNNLPHHVIAGNIVIVENGRVVEGDFLNAVALLQDNTINGVFKVNTEDYIIFTAD